MHQHDALHHRIVAVEDRIDDELAEARNGEDLLGQHGARQQRAESSAPRVMTGVSALRRACLQHDALFGQALGARGADIVALQRLQHGAAGMAHEHAGDGVAEHEGRHDGRREFRQSSHERTKPEAGSQPSFTENSMISMMPSQKFGMEMPHRATTLAA